MTTNGSPNPSERRPRVLLLEDDDALRRLLGQCLGQLGYQVTVATELEEAAALLSCRDFDLLCTDLSFDALVRFEALDLIEEAKTLQPGLAVIVNTGSGDADVHAACRARGADRVMVKSASPEPLLRVVDEMLWGGSSCAAN
jgi:CheY-like chemotaxis protein